MMTKRRIVVDVRSDGTIAAATHGYAGPTCLDAVSLIEDLVQAPIESSALTDEFYRPVDAEIAQVQDFNEDGAS
jgi:hypothetical protein